MEHAAAISSSSSSVLGEQTINFSLHSVTSTAIKSSDRLRPVAAAAIEESLSSGDRSSAWYDHVWSALGGEGVMSAANNAGSGLAVMSPSLVANAASSGDSINNSEEETQGKSVFNESDEKEYLQAARLKIVEEVKAALEAVMAASTTATIWEGRKEDSRIPILQSLVR